jgi:hypothetical protein
MIVHLRDPKISTKKQLEIINSFSKIAGYKISIRKSVIFLYTKNKQSEKEIRETIPFTLASEKIKHFRINLMEETTYLF